MENEWTGTLLIRYGLYFVQGMILSDGGCDQFDSGATYVATNGTNATTEDKPSAVTGMDGLYRVDVDQLDADMMKHA